METENQMTYTPFSKVYDVFLSKITDDMYLEFTLEDTLSMLKDLLISAIPDFEFPRVSLEYEYLLIEDLQNPYYTGQPQLVFKEELTDEEVNVLATYMVVHWLGQQLASIQNVRMKYSGSDFKFTSQANHMQKILQMKNDYQQKGFKLQRLYKRRLKDKDGIYRSTFGQIMGVPDSFSSGSRS